MAAKSLQVFWTSDAQKDFNEIVAYYKSQSNQAHKLVQKAILKTLSTAATNPFIFETDKLRTRLDENFRKFTIYHISVTYEIRKEKLFVLRLRHTSREPLSY